MSQTETWQWHMCLFKVIRVCVTSQFPTSIKYASIMLVITNQLLTFFLAHCIERTEIAYF